MCPTPRIHKRTKKEHNVLFPDRPISFRYWMEFLQILGEVFFTQVREPAAPIPPKKEISDSIALSDPLQKYSKILENSLDF